MTVFNSSVFDNQHSGFYFDTLCSHTLICHSSRCVEQCVPLTLITTDTHAIVEQQVLMGKLAHHAGGLKEWLRGREGIFCLVFVPTSPLKYVIAATGWPQNSCGEPCPGSWRRHQSDAFLRSLRALSSRRRRSWWTFPGPDFLSETEVQLLKQQNFPHELIKVRGGFRWIKG